MDCIKLSSETNSDIAVSQLIKGLEPGKLYRLHAKIKADNISGIEDGGANISVVGEWWYSPMIQGTMDWTNIYLDFIAPASGALRISCRLGFWNSAAKGAAYFDNLRLEKEPTKNILQVASI